MYIFEIIGVFVVIVAFKLCIIYSYLRVFGQCSIDHDSIGRQGVEKCPKCKEEF